VSQALAYAIAAAVIVFIAAVAFGAHP